MQDFITVDSTGVDTKRVSYSRAELKELMESVDNYKLELFLHDLINQIDQETDKGVY